MAKTITKGAIAATADPRLRVLDEGARDLAAAWREATGFASTNRSLLRYTIAGLRGIRLESIKIAGKRLTSVQAVRRFVSATQDVELQPRAASIDVQAADKVLSAFGLGREQVK